MYYMLLQNETEETQSSNSCEEQETVWVPAKASFLKL